MESFGFVLVSILIGVQICQAAEWSYTGDKGVTNWAKNFPGKCDGQRQSPVDLLDAKVYYEPTLQVFELVGFNNVNGVTWSLINNGHTVQVTYTNGNLEVKGGSLGSTYGVVQFHFHWGSDNTKGSEHTVNGNAYPLEVHIVCVNKNYPNVSTAVTKPDGVAALGFFFEVSANSNPTVQKLVDSFPSVKYAGNMTTIQPFPLNNLIAGVNDFYRYKGSFTTPSCNEVVTWTVFKDTIKISSAQLSAFRNLMDDHRDPIVKNHRPTQELYGRRIEASFNDENFASGSAGLVLNSLALVSSLALSAWLRL